MVKKLVEITVRLSRTTRWHLAVTPRDEASLPSRTGKRQAVPQMVKRCHVRMSAFQYRSTLHSTAYISIDDHYC